MTIETNRLFRGNCLDFMRSLPDSCVDLVVTDPPYGVAYVTNHRSDADPLKRKKIENDSGDWMPFARAWFEEVVRLMKPNTHFYSFGSFLTQPQMQTLVGTKLDFKNTLIWDKLNSTVGDLEGDYGRQYEVIYYAQKGRRILGGGQAVRQRPARLPWQQQRLRTPDAEARGDHREAHRVLVEGGRGRA